MTVTSGVCHNFDRSPGRWNLTPNAGEPGL